MVEKYKFRVLKFGSSLLEGAQLFIQSQLECYYGNLGFEEIESMEQLRGRPAKHGWIYEISGDRKLNPEEARKALNDFISPASDTGFAEFSTPQFRRNGIEFSFREAAT